MTLRQKTLRIISLTALTSGIVLYLVARAILNVGLTRLETQTVNNHIQQVLNILDDELMDMDSTAHDWASWDDTWNFIQTGDQAYIQNNLMQDTFVTLGLDMMLFLNESGEVIWSQDIHLGPYQEYPVDAAVIAQLETTPLQTINGLIRTPAEPILIAQRPILNSLDQGPALGKLVLGRYLSEARIKRLSGLLNLSLSVWNWHAPHLPLDLVQAQEFLNESQTTWIQTLSSDTIAGYILIYDLTGQPAAIVRLDIPRHLYHQGQISLFYLLSFLILISGLFGLITVLIVEKMVLSRLTQLHTQVGRIGAQSDLSMRVEIAGQDELGSLSDAINGMLNTIERAQNELRESRERYYQLFNSGNDMILVHEITTQGHLGRIIEANRAACQILGYTHDELLRLPSVYTTDAERWLDQEILTQQLDQNQHTLIEKTILKRDGVAIPVEISIHLLYLHGQSAMLSIIRDITQRRQAEAELKQRLEEQEMLLSIGQVLSSSQNIRQVTQLVAEYMAHLVGAYSAVIYRWDAENNQSVVIGIYERGDCTPHPLELAVGQTRSLAEHSTMQHILTHHESVAGNGIVTIPLIDQDRMIGIAEIYLNHQSSDLGTHDLRLLRALADQVAVVIENARLFSAVQEGEAMMRRLSLRLINIQEQERRYIAQELHDELGQLLTALKINIDLTLRKIPDAYVNLRQRLQEASQLAEELLINIRSMTIELRPTLLDDMGIVPALRWYLKRFEQRTGIEVQADIQELPRRLLPEIEATLYRVTQEALTNIVRHAEAERVSIEFEHRRDTIALIIQDDGVGFDMQAWTERANGQHSLGLTGIQERARLLNGRAHIFSQPGQGTQITLTLPASFQLHIEEP